MNTKFKTILIVVALVQLGAMACSAPPQERAAPPPTVAPTSPIHLDQVEDAVREMTNVARRENGLPPLGEEYVLRETAREHCDDMLLNDYFDHVNKRGLAPEDRIAIKHRRMIGITGENIWTGYGYEIGAVGAIADAIMKIWLNSPQHRANILDARYNYIGIGVSALGNRITATQNFAQVMAYTNAPVPLKAARGERLYLNCAPVSPFAGAPTLFDFYVSATGVKAAGPFPIENAAVNAAPGVYKLRFYFPDQAGRNFTIFTGPEITVE